MTGLLDRLGQRRGECVGPFLRDGCADFHETMAKGGRVVGTLTDHDVALAKGHAQGLGRDAGLHVGGARQENALTTRVGPLVFEDEVSGTSALVGGQAGYGTSDMDFTNATSSLGWSTSSAQWS